jgi:hypothetical protein
MGGVVIGVVACLFELFMRRGTDPPTPAKSFD